MTKAISGTDLYQVYFDLIHKFNLRQSIAACLVYSWSLTASPNHDGASTKCWNIHIQLAHCVRLISQNWNPLISTVQKSDCWSWKVSGNVYFNACQHQTWRVHVWDIVPASGGNANYMRWLKTFRVVLQYHLGTYLYIYYNPAQMQSLLCSFIC